MASQPWLLPPFRVPPPAAFDGRWYRLAQGLSTRIATHRNIDVPGRTCTGELLRPRGAVLRFEVVSEVADELYPIRVLQGGPSVHSPSQTRKQPCLPQGKTEDNGGEFCKGAPERSGGAFIST